jgi:hypothetical protein
VPVIDLPADLEFPGTDTYLYPVMSVMLYPRDADLRAQWLAVAMIRAHHAQEHDSLSYFPVGVLWTLKQVPRRVYSDGLARLSRAELSGHVLFYFLRLALNHHRHCKAERAKALVVNFSAAPTGETISESLVNKTWAEFKSVSHLWASLGQFLRSGSEPISNTAISALLNRAEAIRLKAEAARLLTPGKSWQAPEGHQVPVDIALPPLDDDQIAFLNQQFPG